MNIHLEQVVGKEKLAHLEVLDQTLKAKNRRIQELEKKIERLEGTLKRVA